MSTVTINQDNTVTINGKKTFVVGFYYVCVWWADGNPTVKPETCMESATKCKGSVIDMSNAEWNNITPTNYSSITKPWIAAHEANDIMYLIGTYYGTSTLTPTSYADYLTVKDNPNFFGLIQADEANGTSQYKTVADMNMLYTNLKNQGVTHPIILNHYKDASIWYPYCDIFTWDNYLVQFDPVYDYTRSSTIFAWEEASWFNIILQIANGDLDAASKPVWTVHQANGFPFTVGANPRYDVPTNEEQRCLAYTSITTGVKGIAFWLYHDTGDSGNFIYPNNNRGLSLNPTKTQEMMELVREIRELNDILVLPNIDKSFQYRKGTQVHFTPNPTLLLHYVNRQVFNYALKQYGSTYYLFVVNKSNVNQNNIQITVDGLTINHKYITTLGRIESGSRANRELTMTNGTFADSFLPYETTIYQISDCPLPQCNFTITEV